jgi:hypothetical protein
MIKLAAKISSAAPNTIDSKRIIEHSNQHTTKKGDSIFLKFFSNYNTREVDRHVLLSAASLASVPLFETVFLGH